MNYEERIEAKKLAISKIEKRITKWESQKNQDAYIKYTSPWYSMNPKSIKTLNELVDARYNCIESRYEDQTKEDAKKHIEDDYQGYLNNCDEEIRRANRDLEEARATLEKYYKMQEAEEDKKNTLNELPEVIITFKNNLIEKWNEYDIRYRESVRERSNEIYKLYEAGNHEEYNKQYRELSRECGGIRECIYKTDEEINKENIKAAEALILNMINRVIEITGKTTDAKCLYVNRDNNGYAIINGLIVGEKGKARIESIGAGGYNIQRYHIRVLVKEVK